jgi:hypothetical protein
VTIETNTSTTGRLLIAGQPMTLTLPAVDRATLFNGDNSLRILVPDTSRALRVQISSDTPGADVDLYVRAGAGVDLADGRVVADFKSEGPTADETITITPNGNPALRTGVYYIAVGVFTTGKPVNVRVLADFVNNTPAPTTPTNLHDLRSGVPARWSLPAVTSPTLFDGDYSYRINVPAGARRLEIRISTATAGADIDLFARYGQDVTLSSGRLQFDHSSEGPTGEEMIVITPTSSPALRAGVYYISFASYTTGRAANGTVVGTVQ